MCETVERVVRFYTHQKDGVAFKQKVSPLLNKRDALKYRAFSNFYREQGFLFVYKGETWEDSETAFQYYRWLRHAPSGGAPLEEEYGAFLQNIQYAATPAKALFLSRFVSYRKRDGVAYCSSPFPQFQWYADLVMEAYATGIRRPEMDDAADYQLMHDLVECKFEQNPSLMALLKSTGSAKIAEHTTRDRKWGDGGDGSGTNWLGKILVAVRDKSNHTDE